MSLTVARVLHANTQQLYSYTGSVKLDSAMPVTLNGSAMVTGRGSQTIPSYYYEVVEEE
jgi:hypothetical protein